jgi:uncharacterized secreted protein with C-terminal beta-propeller domain
MNKTLLFTASLLATILIISSVPIYLYLNNPQDAGQIGLNKFSSYDDLKDFLETTSSVPGSYGFGRGGSMLESGDLAMQDANTFSSASSDSKSSAGASDYSDTNIQVEGVDEADIVKTDGEYLYIVSGCNVTLVKAYPPEEAEILSRISLNGSIAGIFINGDKLAIFETEYTVYRLYDGIELSAESSGAEEPSSVDDDNRSVASKVPSYPEPITYEPPTTAIKVYDISDRENPVLTSNFSVDGSYFSSRMIGDYIYFVATMYTYYTETAIALPRIQSNNETDVIAATDIYYCNLADESYTFTTLVALNIQNDSQEPTHETIVLGATSNIYVSQSNIYLTFPDYSQQENMRTTIQRIKIEQQAMTFEAAGEVPGYILNQFSMDEHDGYFRVTTTVRNNNWRTFTVEETSGNNLYVLDMNLTVVGKLEGLAPGEQIYSTRFMGDRCYMVTYRQIDPFYVIDVANPTEPKVLGYLKIPGFSGYLHPYDENHVIGLGKQDNKVKLSLFDVTNVSAPTETAKFIVEKGEMGFSDSPVRYDHKAFLFDKSKQLLAIPISTIAYDVESEKLWYWRGAYIFNASLEQGFTLEGEITHQSGDNPDGYMLQVNRILYIENVLYTISYGKVRMNSLDTLAEIGTIEIA